MAFDTYRITGIYRFALLYDSSGTAAERALSFANGAAFKNDIKTIEYKGDGQTAKKYVLEAVDVEVETDDYGVAVLKSMFGKTEVTASLPSDEAVRIYFGDNTDSSGVVCGVAAYFTAEKLSTGANVRLRAVAPRGTLSSPDAPELKNRDKAGMKLKFSANKTTTDIAGDALPGVPTDGCYWYMAELS